MLNVVRGIVSCRGTPWRARRDKGHTMVCPYDTGRTPAERDAPTSFTLAEVYACEDVLL